MGRRIHAWCPPGHGNDEGVTVGVGLSRLVDPQDPALHHITKLVIELKILNVELTEDLIRRVVMRGRKHHEDELAAKAYRAALDELRVRFEIPVVTVETAKGAVVYYMRIGNRVKIGFSTKLTDRLKVINPEELLAFEPGTLALERARHAEFADLRVNGEWFRFEAALAEHVRDLQASLRADR